MVKTSPWSALLAPVRSLAVALVASAPIAALPADPPQDEAASYQHIWLHYDYMVAADHSHEPDAEAIKAVVAAFKRQGIILHVDPKHAAIPERKVVRYLHVPDDCMGPDWIDFDVLQEQYFDPPSSHPWHYTIFGHYHDCDTRENCLRFQCGPTIFQSAGVSGPGYLFLVTLGGYWDGVCLPSGLCFGVHGTPPSSAVAGALMHELGHNFSLRHGGVDDLNYKPNYLSVMNYSFQNTGIPFGDHPGSTTPIGYRVDYSGAALPTLDETDVDELAGIGAGTTDITKHQCWIGIVFAAASGPIDWNCDGALESGFQFELNRTPLGGGGFEDLLVGFDDWAQVRTLLLRPGPAPKAKAHEIVSEDAPQLGLDR